MLSASAKSHTGCSASASRRTASGDATHPHGHADYIGGADYLSASRPD